MDDDPLDRLYRKQLWPKIDKPGADLTTLIDCLARLPLAFQPGTTFRYSFSIDVLGRLVEVISGQRFDDFLRQRIFDPLGMVDTGFWVPPEKVARFALNYGPDDKHPGKLKDIDPPKKSGYMRPGSFFSGGGGLVSTAADYLRFCQMLLNGGVLDGERILGRKTVELMRTNHLPEGVYQDEHRAYGFGLGGNVLVHPNRAPALGTQGSWGWGGAANTKFWVDWQEQLIGLLMLQFMPSDKYPIALDYQNLVYQALID
jgi:CubicO group peptidase (beta-lactamase class C family)